MQPNSVQLTEQAHPCSISALQLSPVRMSAPTISAVRLPLSNEIHCFDVDAFGCRIRAIADSWAGMQLLERCIFPSLRRSAGGAQSADILVRVGNADGGVGLWLADEMMASAPSLDQLEASSVRVLDDAIVARLSSWRVIHAGVVAVEGQGLLLPGRTHSGKSTLVAELVRRGAVYLSDEYALIGSEGLVHPYPRPMLLRNGAPESHVAPVAECGTAPVPIGWIFGLTWQAGCCWNPVLIDQSQAVMLLLQNTPHVLGESPELVRYFERAVAQAQTYTGCRPDAAEAAAEILRLTASTGRVQ